MGWELAGFRCAAGETATYPAGIPTAADAARARAGRFADRHGVQAIDHAGLERLRAEPRTLYLLDVRAPAEYAAGHLPGALSAPGGQLVQATDRWVAVRGARIVLCDGAAYGQPDGTRARMAGGWLRQLGGWEVFVLEGEGGAAGSHAGTGDDPPLAAGDAIAPEAAARLLEAGGAAVVDIRRSLDFREAQIPGSLWGIRTRLDALRGRLAGAAEVVVVAPGPALGLLAARELSGLTGAVVRVLAGGMPAWRKLGLPVLADRHNPPDADCADVYLRPYDRNEGIEEAMREYLSWEIDLVNEVARDGDARFGTAATGGAQAGGGHAGGARDGAGAATAS
nr:rhodanese-like domain-containing protein [Roseomonas acroporae]